MEPSSSLLAQVVPAAASGCVATVIGHPLDCIKVHMQASQNLKHSNTLHAAASLLKAQGPKAFTRGLGPPLANACIMNTLMFVAFDKVNQVVPNSALGSMFAGAVSGLLTAFLSTPTDWLKVQAQIRSVTMTRALSDALRSPLGLSWLFTGHTMNCLREGVFTAVYLGLYARLRQTFAPAEGGLAPLHLVAMSSAATGALAWAASYPFDSIKSVQQAQSPSAKSSRATIKGALNHLWKLGGVGAYYRGLGASTFRAILVTCSRLVGYEFVKDVLSKI